MFVLVYSSCRDGLGNIVVWLTSDTTSPGELNGHRAVPLRHPPACPVAKRLGGVVEKEQTMRRSLKTYDPEQVQKNLFPIQGKDGPLDITLVGMLMIGLSLIMVSFAPRDEWPRIFLIALAIIMVQTFLISVVLVIRKNGIMEYIYRNVLGYTVWVYLDPDSAEGEHKNDYRCWRTLFTTENPIIEYVLPLPSLPIAELRLGGWFRSLTGNVYTRDTLDPFGTIRITKKFPQNVGVKITDNDGTTMRFSDIRGFLTTMRIVKETHCCDTISLSIILHDLAAHLSYSMSREKKSAEQANKFMEQASRMGYERTQEEAGRLQEKQFVELLVGIVIQGIKRLHGTRRLVKSKEGAAIREELTRALLDCFAEDKIRYQQALKALKDKDIPMPPFFPVAKEPETEPAQPA